MKCFWASSYNIYKIFLQWLDLENKGFPFLVSTPTGRLEQLDRSFLEWHDWTELNYLHPTYVLYLQPRHHFLITGSGEWVFIYTCVHWLMQPCPCSSEYWKDFRQFHENNNFEYFEQIRFRAHSINIAWLFYNVWLNFSYLDIWDCIFRSLQKR